MLAIVLGSTMLGFVQEYTTGNAVGKLRSQVTIRSRVLRGGQPQILPSEQVVPGDVVVLSAGSLIPADGIVLEANDFFVNQAVLTGETFPVGKKVMVLFGLVRSVFDFLTFGTLLFLFRVSPEEFRTGWFFESLITELVIALVVRTRHLFFRSRPGTLLLASTLTFVAITLVLPHLPYLPFVSVFGFVPLPAPLMLTMLGLTTLYVLATELTKSYFHSRMENAIAWSSPIGGGQPLSAPNPCMQWASSLPA